MVGGVILKIKLGGYNEIKLIVDLEWAHPIKLNFINMLKELI